MRYSARIAAGLMGGALLALPTTAGVINPDISAIGQVLGGITGDPGSTDQDEPTLSLGESEFILDAALNPYLKGFFTIAAGEEGFDIEEAYAAVLRGLPYGLGIKTGKYRLGLGKLNPVHPHAYPFIDPPRAWVSLLGEEGFNEVAVQASILLPTPGDWASTFSVDMIQGNSFHEGQDQTRLGWLGRWSNSFLIGEKGAFDMGLSGATGTDVVAGGGVEKDHRGYLAGADLKAKFYLPGASQLTLQGEGLFRRSHSADSVTGVSSEDRRGFYAFADYKYHTRWNFGALYDQVERAGDAAFTDRSIKAFTGFAVLEESTMLRAGYEYFMPEGEDAFQTLSLQFLFSMGPHKPHQF